MKGVVSLLVFALAVVPAIAVAEPVYLECEIASNESNAAEKFSVSLDEQDRAATHVSQERRNFNADAMFTVNEISYKDQLDLGFVVTTWTYTIDRSTLELSFVTNVRYREGPEAKSPETSSRTGMCSKVVPAADRLI